MNALIRTLQAIVIGIFSGMLAAVLAGALFVTITILLGEIL